jgi:hypothetical protein
LTKRSMKTLKYDPDTHPIFRIVQPFPRVCEGAA